MNKTLDRAPARTPFWKRGLAVFMTALSLIPSFASATSPSTLVQIPPFTATEPAANVFMMLDDSSSMGLHEFSVPSGITIVPTTLTVTVTGRGGDEVYSYSNTRSFTVNTYDDWVLRSPALNPIWYNPSIQYKPWNNDGATTFVNAKTGGTAFGGSGAHPDNNNLTERDMRYIPGTTTKLNSGAGTIGPWNNYQDTDTPDVSASKKPRGHLVSQAGINFRYYGLPMEWGTANTTNTDNAITDSAPRDLFTKPYRTVNVAANSGCFSNTPDPTLQCRAGVVGKAQVYNTQTCAGAYVETPNQSPITCYTRVQDCLHLMSTIGPDSTAQPTLTCYTRRTSCANGADNITTTPQTTLNCWLQYDCTNTAKYFDTQPADLTCPPDYTRRTSCTNATVADYGLVAPTPPSLNCWTKLDCSTGNPVYYDTDPGSVPPCGQYQRRGTCSSSTIVPYGLTDPGPLNCFQITSCMGVTTYSDTPQSSFPCGSYTRRTSCTDASIHDYLQTAPSPATLNCWKRYDCANNLVYFDSDPNVPTVLQCGGYTRATSCTDSTSMNGPTDPGTLTCWSQQQCLAPYTVHYYDHDPGPLTCGSYTRRNTCEDGTVHDFMQANPGDLPCYQRTNCSGTVEDFTADPGPIPCGEYTRRTSCADSTVSHYGTTDPLPLNCFQRMNCDGSTSYYTTDPGGQTCGSYKRRNTCADSTSHDFGNTNPGPINCYQRNDCSGTTVYTDNDPGPITCSYTRRTSCSDASSATTPTDPGTLNCYPRRTSCTDSSTTSFPSDPGPLYCPYYRRASCTDSTNQAFPAPPAAAPATLNCYTRTDCVGTTSTTTADPGTATCYSQTDCTGTVQHRGPGYPQSGPFVPDPISCASETEVPTHNYQTSSQNNSTMTPFAPTGGETYAVGAVQTYTSTPNQNASSSIVFNITDSPANKPSSGIQFQDLSTPGSNPSSGTTFHILSSPSTNNSTQFTIAPTPPTPHPSSQESFGLLTSPTTHTSTGAQFVDTNTPTPNPSSQIQFTFITQPSIHSSTPNQQFTATMTSYSAVPGTRNGTQQCPVAFPNQTSCNTDGSTGPDSRRMVPAHWYSYNGSGAKGDPASYTLHQIDRNDSATSYTVINAVTGVAPTVPTNRKDCVALDPVNHTICSPLEEAQNFANWYAYYRTRLFAAIGVISQSMSDLQTGSQQSLRIGYGRINYFSGAIKAWNTLTTEGSLPAVDGFSVPSAIVRGVRPFASPSTDRQAFFDWLFSIGWVGSTPNREAIDSVGRYFSYADNRGPWGEVPGTNDTRPQIACRRNYLMLTTDGEWTNVSAGQPIISSSGPLDAGSSNPTSADGVTGPLINGSGAYSGSQYQYIPANEPQYSGGSSSEIRTLSDVTAYYWNRDLRPDLNNVIRPQPASGVTAANPAFWQSMSTYIIGYGLSADMDTPTTRNAVVNGTAVNWPVVDGVGTDTDDTVITGGNRVNDSFRGALNSRGNFYTAVDVETLANSINSTFAAIQKVPGSAGGIAVTSPVVGSETLAFVPGYLTGDWTGYIKGYTPDKLASLSSPTPPLPDWTAIVPLKAARKIFTSTSETTAIAFSSATSLTTDQQNALTNTGLPAQDVVDYIAGDQSKELEVPVGTRNLNGKYRTRVATGNTSTTGPLGDIVNSAPLYSRVPDFGYGVMPTIGSAYQTYLQNAVTQRIGSVTVGANDGMLHAFKVVPPYNNTTAGTELYAYVPRAVYPTLGQLPSPGYAHRYYVDGPVVQGDAYDGSNWRHIVVGSGGAGPISLFAIDDTRPDTVGTSSVLWDIANTGDPSSTDTFTNIQYVGHVLGTGIIGRVRTGPATTDRKWVYIVGNGEESTSNQAALLVIGIFDHTVTAIPVGPTWAEATNTPAQRNGMGGVGVVYDGERNIGLVYAGDKQGNLWKFNFTAGIPSNSVGFNSVAGAALFTATGPDATNTTKVPQPISAAPRIALHPKGGYYVLFGTGKLYDVNDPTDGSYQSLYGIWDDPAGTLKISKYSPTVDLVDLSLSVDSTGIRTFDTGINWSATVRGWYVDMRPASLGTGAGSADTSLIGERVVSDPTLDGVQFTIASYAPGANIDPCSPGGLSYIYVVNLISGTVTAYQVPGIVGKTTPFVIGLLNQTTTDHTTTGNELGSSLVRDGTCPVSQPNCNQRCNFAAPGIKGAPSAIAMACPAYVPMRVWRQPLIQ